jgi:hypothetical protein
VYIEDGICAGESVIISGLAHPVDGMAVEQTNRLETPEPETAR